jgi:phosphoadenosine phosphosulfate reductase
MESRQQWLPNMGMTVPEKTALAIKLLRGVEPSALELDPENGYYLAFSGGKDSVVIKALAVMAGVKFKAHYSVTTIDPPELLAFMREHHPDVQWHRKKQNMLTRASEKMMPTRFQRWCCEEYKESGGKDRVKVLGVRGAESPRRAKNWRMVDKWRGDVGLVLNPILLWTDEDVWDFIHSYEIPYCSLYDEGFTRLGCIGCPMATEGQRREQFDRWPKYEANWQRAAKTLWDNRAGTLSPDGREWYGSRRFRTFDEFWMNWLRGEGGPQEEEPPPCLGHTNPELW